MTYDLMDRLSAGNLDLGAALRLALEAHNDAQASRRVWLQDRAGILENCRRAWMMVARCERTRERTLRLVASERARFTRGVIAAGGDSI